MISSLTVGISEKIGNKIVKNPIGKTIRFLSQYLINIFDAGIDEVIFVVGGLWRHKFIRILADLDLPIEIIVLHNMEWYRGSGTIIKTLGDIVDSEFIFLYDYLIKPGLTSKLMNMHSYSFGYIPLTTENVRQLVEMSDIRVMTRGNRIISIRQEGDAVLTGPYIMNPNIFTITRKIDMTRYNYTFKEIIQEILGENVIHGYVVEINELIFFKNFLSG